MTMEPKNSTMADLFEKQCVYLVPKYQRQYVWRLEDQWEPLWLDVIEIASVLYNDAKQRNSVDISPSVVDSHFLGAVVLKVGGITPDAAQTWKVIDGQQRITTIQLLMVATYGYLHRSGLSQAAKRLELLVRNSASTGSSQLKINHRETSYEQFSTVVNSVFSESNEIHFAGSPMVECYEYFSRKVATWFSEKEDSLQSAANALIHTLISKLILVAIYLDTNDREYLIFETLNSRGEPLTEWDKCKNFLLYETEEHPQLEQDEIYDNYLTRFDDAWWRGKTGRGAQERPRTDVFTDYWLESRELNFVAVKRVFKEFKKHIEKGDLELESEIVSFFQDAGYFRRFRFTNYRDSNFETQFHNVRIGLSIGAVWPLLLYLQRLDTTEDTRKNYFQHLESYFVRRKICGYQARGYDQLSLDLLEVLDSSECASSEAADLIRMKLLSYSERANIWPSDQEVVDAVLNRWQPRSVQLILLRAIENHISPDLAAGHYVLESVHVEHLMPKTWSRENWPLDADTDDAVESRNMLIYTTGNLTLLNAPLNIRLQNKPWCEKRVKIKKSDNLFLNKQLLEDFYTAWNEDTIRTRGERFSNYILKIWPHGNKQN